MPVFETDLLLELVARKCHVLGELCSLGRRQLELIDREEMDGLLSLLAGKQQLLRDLQQTERELDPFRRQKPDERKWRGAAERARCAQLLERCEALLAEIVDQEKQSELRLRVRRDEAAARLEGMHASGAACQAYAGDAGRGPAQLDLASET